MDCSTPGLPVSHHLLKFAQVHVHSCDAIQPSHPLMPFSPSALNLSQPQGLFQWVSCSHQMTKILELQHQSFQWVSRVDFPQDWLVWSTCCPRDSQESSSVLQCRGINSSALCLLYCPPFTTVHNHWGDHSLDYMDLCRQSNVSAFQHTVYVCHRFSAKKQMSSDFMAVVIIHRDFKAWEEKSVTTFTFSLSICHEEMGPDAMILVILILSFKPALSLSSFALIKKLFSIINTFIHTYKWMWKQWK